MAEKHGGSTLEITTNVAKFFPPWTVIRDGWLTALRPDVSGVAVETLQFHEAGRRLVHHYRVYKDPFPHVALRDSVIPAGGGGIYYDTPAAEMVPMTTTSPESSLPPPLGFAPFVFPENDGGWTSKTCVRGSVGTVP